MGLHKTGVHSFSTVLHIHITYYILHIHISIIFLCFGITFYTFNEVYRAQPTPFLDEIFHLPQVQNYCKWLFKEWDPKITTLPGLYLLSVGVLTPLSTVVGHDLCTVYGLRCTNLVAWIAICFLLNEIQQRIHFGTKMMWSSNSILWTINLASFPVLYFFTFLYYTDSVATCMVLLMYLLHLENRNSLAAAAGFVAVVVRQTNIIWVAFVASETVFQVLRIHVFPKKRKGLQADERNIKYVKSLLHQLPIVLRGGLSPCLALVVALLRRVWGYALVCLCFVIFVSWNGSLVVGDKNAHEAVLHLPQLLYFSLFTTIFCSPFFVFNIKPFIITLKTHKILALATALTLALIIYSNTLVHSYLLADNRHYTFYIWKRLYERHFSIKYLLIPVYMFGAFSILESLKTVAFTFRVNYLACLALCLVPQKLLEFRYFIIPYLLLRIQLPGKSRWPLVAELVLYSCVNAATIYVFLSRTFQWPDSPLLHRFLW